MRKYVAEFIGTFFLVFTVGMCVLGGTRNPNLATLAPFAIGSVLMVMIFAGGHISGAHFNPAVTIAVWVRGKCTPLDGVCYIVAQLLAGTAAAMLVVHVYFPPVGGNNQLLFKDQDAIIIGMVSEFLFTFALAYVVLNSATSKDTSGNSFYGLAIGFTVLSGAIAVGAFSRGVFNPAVATGIRLMNIAPLEDMWVYGAAQVTAALVAGIAFRLLNPDDK